MDGRLLWLAAGAFSTSLMAFVFAGLLPLISASAHITISEAGHLVTAYSLSYAIGTPILATLSGAADRKRVVVSALVLFLIGNAMAAASNSFVLLTAAQIVMGAAAGLYSSTAQATAVTLVICLLIALILLLLPSAMAGPLLIAIMVPWGIVGWTFPPAQGSRIVALDPNITYLTLPLNMSAMYFGVAAGSLVGGRALTVMPAADLALIGAAFPLVALLVLFANGRARKPVLAGPGE